MPFHSGRFYGIPQLCQTATLLDNDERLDGGYPPQEGVELTYELNNEQEKNRELTHALEHALEKNRELETRYAHFTGETARILGERHGATPHDPSSNQLQEALSNIAELEEEIKREKRKHVKLEFEKAVQLDEATKTLEAFKKHTRIPPDIVWTHMRELIRRTATSCKIQNSRGTYVMHNHSLQGILDLVLDIMKLTTPHTLWNDVIADTQNYDAFKINVAKIGEDRQDCKRGCDAIAEKMSDEETLHEAAAGKKRHAEASDESESVKHQHTYGGGMRSVQTMPGLISAFDGFPWSSQY